MATRWHKRLRILIAAFASLLVAIAALPLWFPWVLRPLAKSFHASYAAYEREGYTRFRLDRIVIHTKSGPIRARQAEAYLPTAWLWRWFRGQTNTPFVIIRSWNFAWQSPPTNQPALSAYARFQGAKSKLARLQGFVPNVVLANGNLRVKTLVISVPIAAWTNGQFSAKLVLPGNQPLQLDARYSRRAPLTLAFKSARLSLSGALSAKAAASGLEVGGTLRWLTNLMDVRADFPVYGIWPSTASARAKSFQIPAKALRLRGYYNLAGSLDAEWKTNRFTLDLHARAAPKSRFQPPVLLETRLSGNRQSAQIDLARIHIPWLDAELSHRTQVLFKAPYLARPATLEVAVDLARQPWIPARGRLTGTATLRPGSGPLPRVHFALSGSGIEVSNITARTVRMEGSLIWPEVDLAGARVELADGSDLALSGRYNVRQNTIATGRLDCSGPFGRRFLAHGLSYGSASLKAQFSGPLKALKTSGALEIEKLRIPRANPMRLEAGWSGRGLDFPQLEFTLGAGDSSLALRGSAFLKKARQEIAVTALDLSRSNRIEMRLERPFRIAVRREPHPAGSATVPTPARSSRPPTSVKAVSAHTWVVTLRPLIWQGTNRELRLEGLMNWPEEGSFQGTAHGLDEALIEDFVPVEKMQAKIETLSIAGSWTNGPLRFRLKSKAECVLGAMPVLANAAMTGDSDGISIQSLSFSSSNRRVCSVRGSVPVVIEPGHTNAWMRLNPNGPVRIRAHTEPDPVFWGKIGASTGLTLGKPELAVDVDGTWSAPSGSIRLYLDRCQFPSGTRALPPVEHLDLSATVTPEALRIAKLTAAVRGQPLRFSGNFPLGNRYWRKLLHRRYLPDLAEATGRFEMTNVDLSSMTNILPSIVVPAGTARADVMLEQGEQLKGELTVSGMRTRPLPAIGPLRDIQFRLLFAGQGLLLTNAFANAGGRRVSLLGKAELGKWLRRRSGLPPFAVHVTGTNVPLLRKPGLLLRGNLDVGVTNGASGPAQVSGTVRLRNSLYLADLQNLVPGEVAAPRQRPPYFSIQSQPWAGWDLKLQVVGNNFMKVETPLFHGKISINLKLQGTLRDPVALGDVKIDSGEVTFPFGPLEVKQGFITLTSDDPYHPKLYVTASSPRYGYEVRMQVTGPVDAPVIEFSSTPPLSSEQIVLMLTTGQLPQGTGATASTQQRAEGLALFVGKNLLSEFGWGPGTESRLTISSGQEVNQTGRPTYQVAYRLTKHWYLVGEYDRFDQFNLNLKWRIYSK